MPMAQLVASIHRFAPATLCGNLFGGRSSLTKNSFPYTACRASVATWEGQRNLHR